MMYFPSSCTECCDLLRVLLHEKPIRRLGLGQIMSHNWFMVVNQRPAKKNQLLVGRKQKVQPVLFLLCFRSSYKTTVGVFHAALRLAGGGRLFHPSSHLCVLRGEQALCSVLRLGLRKQYLRLAVLLPEGCVHTSLVAPFCLSHHGHSIPEVPVTAIQTHRPRPKLFICDWIQDFLTGRP